MKPALMLPMGKEDWERCQRWHFLQSCQPILERLGWTIGVELKGKLYDELWITDCITAVNHIGGRITWHLPIGETKKLHKGITSELKIIGEYAELLKRSGLEAVTIHCAPAVSVDPLEEIGSLERYSSPISAEEMVMHIKAQVEPLKQLNELVGGILHIENVDIIQFRGGGYRVPTYLALQTGCFLDLVWLRQQTSVQITLDSEHFLCSQNLLLRKGDFERLLSLPNTRIIGSDARDNMIEISGYRLAKGKLPRAVAQFIFSDYVIMAKPHLFHLGGATRAVDEAGRIETHLPTFDHPEAKEALECQLRWTMSHPEVIGAVIEVTGQLQPDKYSPWSPRPYDDEVAKMQSYLAVINEIEELQTSS